MLIESIRIWRGAREARRPVQPSLTRGLSPYGCTMLAPVLDSLCHFYESAMGRAMRVGRAPLLSDDEYRLLALLDGSMTSTALPCSATMAALFEGMVRSVRIMLAMAADAVPAALWHDAPELIAAE